MMIGEPEAILLDEPFSALDGYLKDVLQREMQDFLKDYPGDMILVTHSRDEAYKFCKELSIVHEGRILVTGRQSSCLRDRDFWRQQSLPAVRIFPERRGWDLTKSMRRTGK